MNSSSCMLFLHTACRWGDRPDLPKYWKQYKQFLGYLWYSWLLLHWDFNKTFTFIWHGQKLVIKLIFHYCLKQTFTLFLTYRWFHFWRLSFSLLSLAMDSYLKTDLFDGFFTLYVKLVDPLDFLPMLISPWLDLLWLHQQQTSNLLSQQCHIYVFFSSGTDLHNSCKMTDLSIPVRSTLLHWQINSFSFFFNDLVDHSFHTANFITFSYFLEGFFIRAL